MTTPIIPLPAKREPHRVKAEPDSRLEQALALYDQFKSQADELESRMKSLKDIIATELLAKAPEGSTRIATDAAALGLAYSYNWIPRTDLDTKRMKAEAPDVYARFARAGGRWELRKATS